MIENTTIVAPATANGVGAIALIRLSGLEAIAIVSKIFKGKSLHSQASHTTHFGKIMDAEVLIDEVLVTIFKAPHSYTAENVVEISCHGSPYIVEKIITLCIKNGATLAQPGEYTQRAFLNGQLDLSQAEAVADIIASQNESMHRVAMQQMRGGFSKKLQDLRDQLIHFVALIELELDFAEEDVEFANRTQLNTLISHITEECHTLIQSFELGNVIKNGIPTAIVGKPNVGKSTLLNTLLNEERAIVSPIAGTTRDSIEEEITIKGIKFRLIDTAGLRTTTDTIEALGVQRAMDKIAQAMLVLYIFDASETNTTELKDIYNTLKTKANAKAKILLIANKADIIATEPTPFTGSEIISISAKNNINIDILTNKILDTVPTLPPNTVVITNIRHVAALKDTIHYLEKVQTGLQNNLTSDWLSADIREALKQLGSITGAVDIDADILGTIFGKFCIGK